MDKILNLLLVLTCLFLSQNLSAQQIVADAIISATEPLSSSDTIMWTVGELMVEYHEIQEKLDQGFLEANCFATVVNQSEILKGPRWELSLWPNPVNQDFLNVKTDGELFLTLFNGIGYPVMHAQCFRKSIKLDLSKFPAASYWLQARDKAGNSRVIQVQKF